MSPKYLPTLITTLSALMLAAAPAQAAKPFKKAPALPKATLGALSDAGSVGLVLGLDKNTYAVPVAAFGVARGHEPQIHAVLTFFNRSQTPLQLYIHGSPTQWQILDDTGKIVWDYSVGRALPHNIRIVTLADNQLRYAQDIPLQTQNGAPLAPGRYTLRGAIPGALGASASLDFTVTH